MKDKEYDILLREYEKLNRERADMYILSFDEHIAYLKRAFLRADFSKHLELDFYNRIMKCRPVQMHLIILRISWRRDVFRATEIMSSSI